MQKIKCVKKKIHVLKFTVWVCKVAPGPLCSTTVLPARLLTLCTSSIQHLPLNKRSLIDGYCCL